MITKISWEEVQAAAGSLAMRHRDCHHQAVWGIPTGGSVVAPFVAKALGVPVSPTMGGATLIVDDLVDSGATFERVIAETRGEKFQHEEIFGPPFIDALFRKPCTPAHYARCAYLKEGWLHFPWEAEAHPEDAVIRLLQFIGEDAARDGLKDTPKRVLKAFKEMTTGYAQDPKQILGTVFEQPYDEVVILKHIAFSSLCEHHLLPFVGTVNIGYVPAEKVVGLSKLARLVDCFANRLQIQERFTRQIAEAIEMHLLAKGVAVTVTASHMCMSCRGVRKPDAAMTTSVMLGVFRDKVEARAEFLELCR